MDRILDYDIRGLLGKGSFSEVYEGQKGDRTVAVKLMKPPVKIRVEELLASLRYEFLVLKDLVHPNIVRLFDFGQLPDGRLYLIEELVRGTPLNVFCENLPFAACEPVFTQILNGLAALERWEIVHGDIKPANILVSGTDKTPAAKILDFGMARPRTGAPFFGGTPSTMAPEVILGCPSDHRCDLYSLGVCFYSSLAGQNPFIEKSVEKTLKAHLNKKVEPIGLARHDVPPEWAELIHQLLEKNPDDRPATALKTLSLVQKDTFVLGPSSFVGRHDLLMRALTIEDALVKAKKGALVVEGENGIGVTRFLREVFYRLISSHPGLRERISLVESLPFPDSPILLIDRLKPPSDYPALVLSLGPLTVEEVDCWLKLMFRLDEIPEKFLGKVCALTGDHPQSIWDLVTFLSDKGVLADSTGLVTRTMLSLINWEEVLPGREIAGGLQGNIDWVFAEVRKKINVRSLLEKDPIWKRLEGLIEQEKDPARKVMRRAEFLALQGEAAIDEGKLGRAKEALTAALEIFTTLSGRKIDELRVRNFLSYILLRQGKPREAVVQFEAALSEIQKTLKPEEVREITNLDLGLAYLQAGDFQKAIGRLQEERDFHQRLASDPIQRAAATVHQIGCLYNLAQAYSALGEMENAERSYHEVLSEARANKEHAYMLRALNGLGNVFCNIGRWQEALKAFGEALEIALAVKDFSSAAAAAQNRGALAESKGLHQEAIRDLSDSLKYVEKIMTPYSFEKFLACRSHVELAQIFVSLKRFDEAKDHLDRAWHSAEKDADLADFRFWVLLARCRFWKEQEETERFKQDLARLNFYTDSEEKRKKVVELGGATVGAVPEPRGMEIPAAATLYESRPSEFDALIRITSDLLAEISLSELLKKIITYAIQLSGAELGVVLLDDGKGELTPVVSLNADLTGELRDISLSVAREVVSFGKIVHARDALSEERFSRHASVLALNLRSIIALPLTFRGKVLGVLYLSHRYRLGLFDERATKVLSVFADQAALALTNHRLLDFYRSAQEKAESELKETRQELTLIRERIRSLPENLRQKMMEGPFKTRSRTLLETLEQVERVASTPLTIVIHGETGTGKELIARYAYERSDRKGRPFIAINCGALPPTLIEGELFGHVKGAFTGADRDKVGLIEAADGGTLFLDEIVDLPLEAQVKLLRVLQEREVVRLGETKPRPVDIRLIAACQRSLKEAVGDGTFREDLYYRLMGLEVSVPSLRERPEDIPLLSEFFLSEYLKEGRKKQPEKIAAPFLRLLTQYDWPGNVRELKNVIATAAALSEGKVLSAESLPKNLRDQMSQPLRARDRRRRHGQGATVEGWYHPGLSWQEHLFLIYASSLLAFDFNVPRAATSLGVGVATVYKWMRDNRIRETREEWRGKITPYHEGTKLSEIRAMVFSQAAKRFPGHPYHAARSLDVAPVTFYRWSKAGAD